jgi:hypothetical protein
LSRRDNRSGEQLLGCIEASGWPLPTSRRTASRACPALSQPCTSCSPASALLPQCYANQPVALSKLDVACSWNGVTNWHCCMQGRRRVFMWGARSGKEQLVPLPAPTHECKDFCTGHPKSAKQCIVSALVSWVMRQARESANMICTPGATRSHAFALDVVAVITTA